MIGDSDLAVLVRALAFQLIGPDGAVAGELISASDAALFPVPLPPTYNGLEMYHRDVATTDSSLRWTYGDAGNESTQLTGPAAAGAATADRPRVSLTRESGLPRTVAKIAAGQNAGGALITEAAVTMESRPGPTYRTLIEAGNTFFDMKDDGTVCRLATVGDLELFAGTGVIRKGFAAGEGLIYGEVFEDTDSAGGNIPNTGVTLVTLAAVNFPVAGWIDITATVQAQVAIINDQLTLTLLVNGAPVKAHNFVPGPMVVGTQIPITLHKRIAVGAGAQTVRLDAAGITNNAYIAGNNTHLSAVFHR